MKILGVTRKAVYVYEDMGLLKPAEILDLLCCIAMENDFEGPERTGVPKRRPCASTTAVRTRGRRRRFGR